MLNVVSKIKYVALLGLLLLSEVSFSQVHNGIYECDIGCHPSDPLDSTTQLFIRSVVNLDVNQWELGDHVTITTPSGESGVWGRLNALNSLFIYFGPAGIDYTNLGSGGGSGGGLPPGGSGGLIPVYGIAIACVSGGGCTSTLYIKYWIRTGTHVV